MMALTRGRALGVALALAAGITAPANAASAQANDNVYRGRSVRAFWAEHERTPPSIKDGADLIFLYMQVLHGVRVRDSVLLLRDQAREPTSSDVIARLKDADGEQLRAMIERYPDGAAKSKALTLYEESRDFEWIARGLTWQPLPLNDVLFDIQIRDQILALRAEMSEPTADSERERLRTLGRAALKNELVAIGLRWLEFNRVKSRP